jgi:hypothetical protein
VKGKREEYKVNVMRTRGNVVQTRRNMNEQEECDGETVIRRDEVRRENTKRNEMGTKWRMLEETRVSRIRDIEWEQSKMWL